MNHGGARCLPVSGSWHELEQKIFLKILRSTAYTSTRYLSTHCLSTHCHQRTAYQRTTLPDDILLCHKPPNNHVYDTAQIAWVTSFTGIIDHCHIHHTPCVFYAKQFGGQFQELPRWTNRRRNHGGNFRWFCATWVSPVRRQNNRRSKKCQKEVLLRTSNERKLLCGRTHFVSRGFLYFFCPHLLQSCLPWCLTTVNQTAAHACIIIIKIQHYLF